jgi:Ser/Thr protein kinase RdoA (MazF antagonist)
VNKLDGRKLHQNIRFLLHRAVVNYRGRMSSLHIPGEAEDALSAWNIGRVSKWRFAVKGEVNSNFILTTTEGKFVLRKVAPGHHKGPRDMEFELSYLNYLRDAHFPYQVPSPVPSVDGRRFTTHEGRYWWLYKFIEGITVDRLNGSQLAQLAKMVSSYHLLIERSRLGKTRQVAEPFNRTSVLREVEDYRSKILQDKRPGSEDVRFMEEADALLPILRGLDGNLYSGLERYPIHSDIQPANLIWHKGRLVGLVDFENVCSPKQPTVKDIAIILQSCRNPRQNHQLDLSLARRFISNYKRRHPVSAQELRLLPSLIIAGFIEDFAYAYWMMKNDPERARAYRLGLNSRAAQWSSLNRDRIARELS